MPARFRSHTACALIALISALATPAHAQSSAPRLFMFEEAKQENSLNDVAKECYGSASADDVGNVYYFQNEQARPRLFINRPGFLPINRPAAGVSVGSTSSSRRMPRFEFAAQSTEEKDLGPPPPPKVTEEP